jgi:hypothetical protein
MKFAGMFAAHNAADAKLVARSYRGEIAKVIAAHNAEIERKDTEVYNYGKVITVSGIYSVTSKGGLDTALRNGKVTHRWSKR